MRLDFAKSISDVGVFSIMKLLKMIVFAIRLFFKLLFHKPDMIYYNYAVKGIALYRDWFFLRIAKLFGVTMILHLRTQGVKEQAAQSSMKRSIFRGSFSNTTLVCLYEYMALDVASVYVKKPQIIANGIEMVIRDVDLENRKEHTPVKFLFLSNLTRSKGIYEFIDALAVLQKKGCVFRAEIVGPEFDVTVEALHQALREKSLHDQVEISEAVYGDAKFQKHMGSDVFVLPTWFEAFPAVVLEAMQCGIPVISTHEGAIPEIIDDGKTGYLVRQKDVSGLAEKMEILLKDKELRINMGAAGRHKFVRAYTSAIFEENMKNVFNEALAL